MPERTRLCLIPGTAVDHRTFGPGIVVGCANDGTLEVRFATRRNPQARAPVRTIANCKGAPAAELARQLVLGQAELRRLAQQAAEATRKFVEQRRERCQGSGTAVRTGRPGRSGAWVCPKCDRQFEYPRGAVFPPHKPVERLSRTRITALARNSEGLVRYAFDDSNEIEAWEAWLLHIRGDAPRPDDPEYPEWLQAEFQRMWDDEAEFEQHMADQERD